VKDWPKALWVKSLGFFCESAKMSFELDSEIKTYTSAETKSIAASMPTDPFKDALLTIQEVVRSEANTLQELIPFIGDAYARTLEALFRCTGKVIVTGVGKSGIIAQKIAATLSSTGTVAVFLHPSDGAHGDIGILRPNDVVLALGKSGESQELLELLPALERLNLPLIVMTCEPASTLAQCADIVLNIPVTREACPYDLAPTASSTAFLAVGDGLAMALMKLKNFQADDFAKTHPGGLLGKRLLLKVSDLLIPLNQCACLDPETATLQDVIIELSKKGQGIVLLSQGENLLGILTDGDIRRLLEKHQEKVFSLRVKEVLNPKPLTVESETLAWDALRWMEDRKSPLNVAPVVAKGKLTGIIRLHELLSLH